MLASNDDLRKMNDFLDSRSEAGGEDVSV